MRIEVDPAGLRVAAPGLGDVGADVDALGTATVPPLAAAGGAVGDAGLSDAVGALLQAVNASVQGAVLSLTELGRAVDSAARDYADRDAEVGRTMRPGPQP